LKLSDEQSDESPFQLNAPDEVLGTRKLIHKSKAVPQGPPVVVLLG
jgi:hypothetical protein